MTESTTTHDSPPTANSVSDSKANMIRRAPWIWVVVVLLTVPPALIQGNILGRWGRHGRLASYSAAVERLPEKIGQWRVVQKNLPLSKFVVELLDLDGYVQQVYESEISGQRVTVLFLVGRSGPLVRHPPEICYVMQGNDLVQSRTVQMPNKNEARLLSYRVDTPLPGGFFVLYAFSDGGRWSCPEYPRVEYAGKPALVKLQVLMDAPATPTEGEPTELIEFAGILLDNATGVLAAAKES